MKKMQKKHTKTQKRDRKNRQTKENIQKTPHEKHLTWCIYRSQSAITPIL